MTSTRTPASSSRENSASAFSTLPSYLLPSMPPSGGIAALGSDFPVPARFSGRKIQRLNRDPKYRIAESTMLITMHVPSGK